ncbi:MAG: DUF2867 domain-containing protein, partial [Actinomycetes bacterium]
LELGVRPGDTVQRGETVRPGGTGRAVYHQRAVFLPRGLAGHLYWWAVAPFHGIVFGGMARNITRTAEGGRV